MEKQGAAVGDAETELMWKLLDTESIRLNWVVKKLEAVLSVSM